MYRDSVFSKTAKGLLEATGKTRALPRDMRALLKEIDGQITAGEVQAKIAKYPDAKLSNVLKLLVKGNFIRELGTPAMDAAPSLQSSPPPFAISGVSLEQDGGRAVQLEDERRHGEAEREASPRFGLMGALVKKSSSRRVRGSPSLLRQTINLSALVLAYLQYFYVDVYLQISSLPTITA